MPGKPVTFRAICKILMTKNININIKLEKLNNPFINNYGEIPRYINRADGDPWDVMIPGYPKLEKNKYFRFKELLGVYILPNGNHKLIIDIHDKLYTQDRSSMKRDILNYKKKYESRTNLKGSIIYF